MWFLSAAASDVIVAWGQCSQIALFLHIVLRVWAFFAVSKLIVFRNTKIKTVLNKKVVLDSLASKLWFLPTFLLLIKKQLLEMGTYFPCLYRFLDNMWQSRPYVHSKLTPAPGHFIAHIKVSHRENHHSCHLSNLFHTTHSKSKLKS